MSDACTSRSDLTTVTYNDSLLTYAVYSVSQKKIPPRGPDIFSFFSQTVENL